LRELKGVGDVTINGLKLIAAAAHRIAKGELKQRFALSSWNDVIDYCRTSMAFADKEQFRILFLDKRNQLISDEVQQTGTVDHTPVYPREVISAPWNYPPPPSSWCTIIPEAIPHPRAPTLT